MSLAWPMGLELMLSAPSGDSLLASSTPGVTLGSLGHPTGRVSARARSYFVRSASLQVGSPPFPRLIALASAEQADRAVATLWVTAGTLGIVGVLLAIILGAIWSAQVARPVERLAAFSERVARGEWDEPLALKSVQELESLVGALDRMREDLRAYRDRLRVSERQAAWGQMARKVAHEIKNPLTPIAISMEDLKRSFEQGRPDFPEILAQATRTVAEEVESMKRMLQELSEFGRFPSPRFESCAWDRIASNLDALYRREVSERRLCIARPTPDPPLRADPGQIQQALVNLIQNGFDAAGADGHVKISVAADNAHVEIGVADDGPGLTSEQRQNLFVPGFTTKERGSGLGLTIVERIVNEHGGSIDVQSKPGAGATITIRLPLSAAAARET
jgi:nitrogen fixation/metabolism regulation signal transduction histidine kinase